MADSQSNTNPSGQLANGPYHGPGCNGWFEPYEEFIKFVHPKANWSWDEGRPATSLFKGHRVSANWSALTTPLSTVDGRPGFGALAVTTALVVSLGQTIKYTPINDDLILPDNPAHCDIVGYKPRSLALKFARSFNEKHSGATVRIRPTRI